MYVYLESFRLELNLRTFLNPPSILLQHACRNTLHIFRLRQQLQSPAARRHTRHRSQARRDITQGMLLLCLYPCTSINEYKLNRNIPNGADSHRPTNKFRRKINPRGEVPCLAVGVDKTLNDPSSILVSLAGNYGDDGKESSAPSSYWSGDLYEQVQIINWVSFQKSVCPETSPH